jgi:spermidine synthase
MLGPRAPITVAELVPEIIYWTRGPMAELAAACLDDPQVDVVVADVSAAMGAAREAFDAILRDVDNGPDGLTRPANDQIYGLTGLASAKAALKRGGLLAIWSAAPDANFTRRLIAAGFAVEKVKVRTRANSKGGHDLIWFAKRP